MQEKTTILLYTTLGCHLCDDAKRVLWELSTALPLRIEEQEISDSNDLIERYGTRIPVIRVKGFSKELDWPFSVDVAGEFVRTCL